LRTDGGTVSSVFIHHERDRVSPIEFGLSAWGTPIVSRFSKNTAQNLPKHAI